MIEFTLAVTLVVLPMISGILEFAQLATARHVLAHATQEAARSAAIAFIDERSSIVRWRIDLGYGESAVRLSYARGLLPLFGGDFASGVEAAPGLERWRLALAEAGAPNRLRIEMVDTVMSTAAIEVGTLRATYCRELFFVPASTLMPALMALWTQDPFERACLDEGRIPLSVTAPMSRSRFP